MKLRLPVLFACAGLLPALLTGAAGADRTVLHGAGRSMLPTLPAVCRLVVVRIPLAEVKVGPLDGDIVATRLAGNRIAHRAVARRPDGSLVTQGDNNPQQDPGITTEANYVGVVVGFEPPGYPGEVQAPSARQPGRFLRVAGN